MIAGPRSHDEIEPDRDRQRERGAGDDQAVRSLIRPLTMAWLARGLVIESTPLRTS